MTLQNIRDRIARIIRLSDADRLEAASGEEALLWRDTLQAIASGADNPGSLATEALKTTQIHFER